MSAFAKKSSRTPPDIPPGMGFSSHDVAGDTSEEVPKPKKQPSDLDLAAVTDPITGVIMADPVILSGDGVTYERSA